MVGLLVVPLLAAGFGKIRRTSASVRAAAWSTVIVISVVIPAFWTVAAGARVAPAIAGHHQAAISASAPKTAARDRVAAATPVASNWLHRLGLMLSLPRFFVTLLAGAWLVIAVFLLARLTRQYARLRTEVKQLAAPCPKMQAYLESVLLRTGLHRQVRFAVSQDHGTSAVAGLMHPTIVIADSIVGDADTVVLERIVVHEAAHLARRDDWVDLTVRIALALAFFNPALWFARRRLELDREIACDDWVLRECGGGREYAKQIVRAARGVEPPYGLAFAASRRLFLRVESILSAGLNRSPRAAPGFVVSGCAVFVSWLLALNAHVVVALGSALPPRTISPAARIAILQLAPGGALPDAPLVRSADLAGLTEKLRQQLEAGGSEVIVPGRVAGAARALGFDQMTPARACVEAGCAVRIGRAVDAATIVVGTETRVFAIVWQTDVRVIAVSSGRQLGEYEGTIQGDAVSNLNYQDAVASCVAHLIRGQRPCPNDPGV